MYYKLKALYVNLISKSHDIPFAPSALKLIENDKRINLLSSADCDPAVLWQQFVLIEQAWAMSDINHSIEWEKIAPNDKGMWLTADEAFRKAFRNYIADELRNADNQGFQRIFFQRSSLESQIMRLLDEILTLAKDSEIKKRKRGRPSSKESDVNVLIPFAKEIWKKEIATDADAMRMNRDELSKRLLSSLPKTIHLHTEGEAILPRAKEAIKRTDPRIFDKTGRYVALRPNWQSFDWIKS